MRDDYPALLHSADHPLATTSECFQPLHPLGERAVDNRGVDYRRAMRATFAFGAVVAKEVLQ